MKNIQIRSVQTFWLILFLIHPGIGSAQATDGEARPPNILMITVDDMNCDSVGAFGCQLPGTTPNIDRLASQGLRFKYAHVVVGNCVPSRNVMMSGRYPHNNRVEGFYQVKADYQILPDLLKSRGYLTAIRGKVSHSTPSLPYNWDLLLDPPGAAMNKNIRSYHESAKRAFDAGKHAGKPFFLSINVSDPHKPFYGIGKGGKTIDDPNKPSRVFTPEQVPVPGYLPDRPGIRNELSHYYSSVSRADDCVGAILRALEESGQEKRTVVMFLSDHGMPFPFSKTCVYHHSTRTPWIVRWPGTTTPGRMDDQHMISAVDLMPTLLSIAGIPVPNGLDGRSFLQLLQGVPQDGWDAIVKEYNENAGAGRHPMRSVQDRRFGYIFNPWSNGIRKFKTATTSTVAYRTMRQLARGDTRIAERLRLFDHRTVEEFYDYEKDPDALVNLISNPDYKDEINRLRNKLETWMVKSGDHALEAFRKRDNPQALDTYMTRLENEAQKRRRQRELWRNNRAG